MILLFIVLIALVGCFALTAVSNSLRYLRLSRARSEFREMGKHFFYRNFQQIFIRHKEYDSLFIATLFSRHILLLSFAIAMTSFLDNETTLSFTFNQQNNYSWILGWISLIGFVLFSLVIGELVPRILSARYPSQALKILAPIASIFLVLCFPFNYFFLKLPNNVLRAIAGDSLVRGSSAQVTKKIIELLDDADMRAGFDANDRKLIESVLTFKDRIVREVMMPRVDVFSLPAEMTIREAAQVLMDEGYSRVPVYKDTVDHIVGVLMYKDILQIYMKFEKKTLPASQLDATLETLIKPVFYTPETKKVSQLLQEFRHKQMHMAIVVDEYGGTEGIVTIEDILEEIVGDIADEYDDQAEALFIAQPTGGWIVDARMSILDIEEKFDISIPQDGDYDTIGGYIYHRAGAIPRKGFRIHHDDFELEILSSNDRAIEKVRIIPRDMANEEHNDRNNDSDSARPI